MVIGEYADARQLIRNKNVLRDVLVNPAYVCIKHVWAESSSFMCIFTKSLYLTSIRVKQAQVNIIRIILILFMYYWEHILKRCCRFRAKIGRVFSKYTYHYNHHISRIMYRGGAEDRRYYIHVLCDVWTYVWHYTLLFQPLFKTYLRTGHCGLRKQLHT